MPTIRMTAAEMRDAAMACRAYAFAREKEAVAGAVPGIFCDWRDIFSRATTVRTARRLGAEAPPPRRELRIWWRNV